MPELGSNEDHQRKIDLYGEDHMPTPEQDLLSYLRGEFQAGEPFQMVSRQSDRVGRRLAAREVSRLEVQAALGRLPYRQRRVMEALFCEDLRPAEVARLHGVSQSTVYADRNEAVHAMAAWIYDWNRRPDNSSEKSE